MTHHLHIPPSVSATVIGVALAILILRRLLMGVAARAGRRTSDWVQALPPDAILVYEPPVPTTPRRIFIKLTGLGTGERTFHNPSGILLKYVYLLPVAPRSAAELEMCRRLEESGESAVQIDGQMLEVDDMPHSCSAEEGWLHMTVVHPSRITWWRPRVRWVAEL